MSVRLALVQPLTSFGPQARDENIAAAHGHAAQASREGAAIVCFPETYPGPWRMPITWTPVQELREIARETGVYVVGGFPEPLDADGRRCYNALVLIGPDGSELGRYRRTTPNHAPWIYRGGTFWDFDWVPAEALPVFQTDVGAIGLLVCSELYAPELARILALKGAEIVFMPAGLIGRHSALIDTWRTLMWARAIENLMITAACSNITAQSAKGLAMVCSPESVLLESGEPGVHLSTVDLERVRWLRAEQDRLVPDPKPWRTKPGNLRDWRRQAVLDANALLPTSDPSPAAPTGATRIRL